MGWKNGCYPSPRGSEPIDERLECEGFRCANRIEDGEEGMCQEKHCHRTVLCDGCTFICSGDTSSPGCGRSFCRDHILVHEQADRFAIYRCVACDRVRQAQEKAA